MRSIVFLAAALSCALALPVHAHITLEYQVAPAASYYKGSFKVGHGCAGSPIRQVVLTIPAGVQGAKPMPKPGWTLEILREKLAVPISDHGRTVTEDVRRITWTAKSREDYLQNTHYDEFVIQAKLPAREGMLYWPISQICEESRIDWAEVPRAGQSPSELKSPAPALDILPAAGGHSH